jgi:DNA ligase-1
MNDKAMMHGTDYAGQDPTGWIVTEKFDGHFARWTGCQLLTREGANYNPPDWFVAGLPPWPIDCELFAGYGKRGSLNGAPRWRDKNRWAGLQLVAFDIPTGMGGYEIRHDNLVSHLRESEWLQEHFGRDSERHQGGRAAVCSWGERGAWIEAYQCRQAQVG